MTLRNHRLISREQPRVSYKGNCQQREKGSRLQWHLKIQRVYRIVLRELVVKTRTMTTTQGLETRMTMMMS